MTGVGNRHSLQAIERSRLADPRQGGFALIQLDVDNFKAINDSFGHHVGDQALIAVAATCRHAVRADDLIARIGGDEFVIVLHRLAEPEAGAREVAHRIHDQLSRPLDCGGRSLRVQVSTGIATASGTTDLHELMVEADLALHAAKERGVNRQEVFADPVRRALVRDLPHALSNGGIGCAFQPQFDLATGEVVGLEALARWPAAGGEAVPVGKLIDTVEWLGETLSLLRCVLTRVEAAYAETHDAFAGRFWVNLSPADLGVADAASALLDLFGAASLPLERLGVEITESLPILDFAQASETLERLRAAGLAIAIDDFGSQNTPLKHLTRLPIDVEGETIHLMLHTGATIRLTPGALEEIGDGGSADRAGSFIAESIFNRWRFRHPHWRLMEHADTSGDGAPMIEVPEISIAPGKSGKVSRKASTATIDAARPPFMSQAPRPNTLPSATWPAKGSTVQPSPASTTSRCELKWTVGPGDLPSRRATTLMRG